MARHTLKDYLYTTGYCYFCGHTDYIVKWFWEEYGNQKTVAISTNNHIIIINECIILADNKIIFDKALGVYSRSWGHKEFLRVLTVRSAKYCPECRDAIDKIHRGLEPIIGKMSGGLWKFVRTLPILASKLNVIKIILSNCIDMRFFPGKNEWRVRSNNGMYVLMTNEGIISTLWEQYRDWPGHSAVFSRALSGNSPAFADVFVCKN